MDLGPPCRYQGGKRRFAGEIAEWILARKPEHVFDLCCGSGAVSIALVQRGLSPVRLTMVDRGPWGDFWRKIGEGELDLEAVERLVRRECPTDIHKIQRWLEEDVALRVPSPETFLVLQASSWLGKPVWWDSERKRYVRREGAFRAFPARVQGKAWRFSLEDRGAMCARLRVLARCLRGARGVQADVSRGPWLENRVSAVWYLDPPYLGTEAYGPARLDLESFIASCPRPLLVSEQRELPGADRHVVLGRRGMTVKGTRVCRATEILNFFD